MPSKRSCFNSTLYRKLLSRFWPGPLTLLLPVVSGLPEALTGGSGRIAARVSSHPAARELALACGFPIVSTSANISGRPAVTSADALDAELVASLNPETDGVFDALPAPGGDATGRRARRRCRTGCGVGGRRR